MKSYETSTATLRAILSHPSLQRDAVESTMDALASATADANDIDQVIRTGGKATLTEAGVVIDDDELEAELAALIQEEKVEAAERLESELLHLKHAQQEVGEVEKLPRDNKEQRRERTTVLEPA